MGKINYSVSGHKAVMGDNTGRTIYYANLQSSGTVTLDELAGHMADHDCKYNKGDIYSVLTQLAKCVREFITDGYKVSLGDLGTVVPRIRQTAQLSAEDFTASCIRDLYAGFRIGSALTNMRGDAEFEYQPTVKNQALLRQAERNGQTSMTLTQKSTSSGSDTGASGE